MKTVSIPLVIADAAHLSWRGLSWKVLPIRRGAEELGALEEKITFYNY